MKPPVTLPGWPRGMPVALAAAYVGLSESALRAGEAGPPVRLTPNRVVWLREALDAYLDTAAGIVTVGDGSEWMRAAGERKLPQAPKKSRYPWRNR